MRWVRIEDNEQAWELMLAGLLWFGESNDDDDMCQYDPHWACDTTTKEQWMNTRFDGQGGALPNYIRVED